MGANTGNFVGTSGAAFSGMRCVVAAAWLVAGCGRIGFDGEAVTDASAPSVKHPAQPPEVITATASPATIEGHPSVTPDLRELYFSSNRGGNFDIWVARRPSADVPFGAPVRVDEVSSPQDEETVDLTPDGLGMYIGSKREGGLGGNDIWYATRERLGAAWSVPQHVDALSSTADDAEATLDLAQRTIVFHSKRAGGKGGRDLWMATRASASATWGTPVLLDALDTAGQDADPFLTHDGLHLMFDSDRNSGNYRELFVASRASQSDAFGAPERIAVDDSDRADADPWLSDDGRYMVFCSSRTGDDEILDVWFDAPLF